MLFLLNVQEKRAVATVLVPYSFYHPYSWQNLSKETFIGSDIVNDGSWETGFYHFF